jgi:hypothetical protein
MYMLHLFPSCLCTFACACLLDKSSFKLILVEYEVLFVFVVYGIVELIEGIEDQLQHRSSEDKLQKKVLIFSSTFPLTSLATFK